MTLSEKAFEIAKKELGVHELMGDENEPRILEYFKCTDLQVTNDDVPWCSAFVNFCFQTAGGQGTRDAMARSWLKWGRAIKDPRPSDIVIFSRGFDGISGHVAFVYEWHNSFMKCLGGNQHDKVCIEIYTKSRVLGYRRSRD